MVTYLGIIAAGMAVRQADRWWFSPRRGRHQLASLRDVMALQRARANNITPALLLVGHWIELIGWCLIAAHGGPVGWLAGAAAGAVKFRHLQEVSHFAVHGVLTRSPRAAMMLAEAAVHIPLGFVPVPVRRQRHVREHHPNATVIGADPNLQELHDAGLRTGVTRTRFVLALVFPLTPAGLAATLRGIADNLRTSSACWWRLAGFAAVPLVITAVFGWQAALFVFLLPRLLLYPQLAWMSLLVEHRWWDADTVEGPPALVEAARCLRLYPRNPVLALLARGTWLPYGDLYHYAHSAHPAVRWNYLPALERDILGIPAYTPDALLLGDSAVARRHFRALTGMLASPPGLQNGRLGQRERQPVS
ncbi:MULTISPECIES: fatty acid desaturase [unclassified Streptomyces]|uniref:fatty acid desaturase n=1 Tax=unclassified Streptomyces TaxID=2593676 RepID=UPI0023658E8E|nr:MULTISPECIES: fatty acid desaturase [unclassified Streptomyces]MDF3141810.1 fatty acid desaturase [Streptomyces sp. T21Q-yed]WDF45099.1 fatty acid desaturase [Streptomyces sp. T12]